MNCNGHSSPVNQKVEGKTHKILEKLKIMSEKLTLFGNFCEVFSGHLCSHLYFSKCKWYYPYTSHMPDFMLILSLLYCWLFGVSALVLGRGSKKEEKNRASSWFQEKINFFLLNLILTMTVIDIWEKKKNGIHHLN